jgi:hypothetical protein
LWPTTIALLFLAPYRKKNEDSLYKLNFPLSVLFFLLGILAGWSYENLGASVLFLLIAYFVMKKINKQKIALFELLGGLGFLIGLYLLVSAPGNYARMELLQNSYMIQDEPFIKGLIRQFLKATEMFFQHSGFLLAGFSALIGFELIFRQKKKINLFTWFYFLAGIVSVYSMTMSPGFPNRAYLIVVVFLCITLLSSLRQAKINLPEVVRKNIPAASVIVLVFFAASFLMASRNVVGIYLKWQDRTQYILEQKAKGVEDIKVKAPIPAGDVHTALHGLEDISTDPSNWTNNSISAFYEVRSIVAAEDAELK